MQDDRQKGKLPENVDISDDDIYEAMKDVPGYLDVTPGDLKEVFRVAYRHALVRLYASVTASDIMTTPVITVFPETPLTEVASLMAEKKISGLPVIDRHGRVAGVISERDFLSRMGSPDRDHVMHVIMECLSGRGCPGGLLMSQKAEEIMSAPALTVPLEATAFDIMTFFSEKKINRVPVVGRDGTLLGIISRADLMRMRPGR